MTLSISPTLSHAIRYNVRLTPSHVRTAPRVQPVRKAPIARPAPVRTDAERALLAAVFNVPAGLYGVAK